MTNRSLMELLRSEEEAINAVIKLDEMIERLIFEHKNIETKRFSNGVSFMEYERFKYEVNDLRNMKEVCRKNVVDARRNISNYFYSLATEYPPEIKASDD